MQGFGQEAVGVCKDDLNALCFNFCQTFKERTFVNEKQWTTELTAFCETFSFTPNDRLLLYAHIKTILLNPEDIAPASCNSQFAEISQHLRSQMQQDSSESGFSAQCAVCSGALGSGIRTECAGKRCLAVFHVRCAASRLWSRKHSSFYYRCKMCAAREIQSICGEQERKRQYISRDDGCTSSSYLETRTGGAYGSARYVAAGEIQGNGKDHVATSTIDAAADDQICGELSIVQDELLSTIQVISQAAHSKVSLENAPLLKQVLLKIRSEVKKLLSLANGVNSVNRVFQDPASTQSHVPIDVGRTGLLDGSDIVKPYGISNSTGTLCCYICLVQAWFHVKSFRKAVFDASCDCASDSFIFYLSSIFHSLQTGKQVDLKVLLRHYFLRSLM